MFVRNPWDRLFSCYIDLLHDKNYNKRFEYSPFPVRNVKILRKIYDYKHQFNIRTFEDFVKLVVKILDFLCDIHILPQHYYFNPQEMDFIGRFENFLADMLKVLNIVAPDCGVKKLEKQNQSSRVGKSYRNHYTDEMREMVARKYARDIELFDYQF